ncbi:MAG: hypothetical protein RJA70_1005 [Pseudomonadota bacterium]|jgi:hypothetical protein
MVAVRLRELVSSVPRLSLFGLAKNTGKTVALGATVRELNAAGFVVGVTSVGRDGEATDALDENIKKPSIYLPAGSIVATTAALLRKSALSREILAHTDFRTPLGHVVIARVSAAGTVEVAGPSSIADVRVVCDEMTRHGAERVVIDGALNRKAATSPLIADGVILSTGAVLEWDLEAVVRITRDAVDLLRLPEATDSTLRSLAARVRGAMLVTGDGTVPIESEVALAGTPERVKALFDAHPTGHCIIVGGALCESFVENVRQAARSKGMRFVVGNSSKVFLSKRGLAWYRAQGIGIEVLKAARLSAITVNPVSPLSHRFDSRHFRESVAAAIPDVRVFDVVEAC